MRSLSLLCYRTRGKGGTQYQKGEDRDLRFEEVETSSQEMSDGQTVRFQTLVFGPTLRASPSSFQRKEPYVTCWSVES